VYLDASRKPASDDFPRDLVKLERSGLCRGCPEHDRCTGLWEPRFDDLFTRDDARVRQIVAALAGDVLDVGCGDGPYDDVLAPLVAAGAVRYRGIDPNPERLARVLARRGWGEHAVGAAEALDETARFDHALLLRSWNHVGDPRRALERLFAALKPGGTLTIVDNVAFGLARMPAQARLAERGPAQFEHFRSDGAADLLALARELTWRVDEVREVSPATSNQWLVGLTRL
jgi:SAM-dependent methyltransferase